MALLRAYFDESGLHGGARVTGIAGFVGSSAAWGVRRREMARRVGRDLPPELRSRFRSPEDAIKAFHAVDCEHGGGRIL